MYKLFRKIIYTENIKRRKFVHNDRLFYKLNKASSYYIDLKFFNKMKKKKTKKKKTNNKIIVRKLKFF
jgi:DNA-binding SARP family transcriptional activator